MAKRIVIIGGGVVGCAVARLMSRYEADVTVLEGGEDVAHGASKANSGIVHAGYDAEPGSLKAKLNVEGAAMYPVLCREVDAPYSRPGAMILAFTPEGRQTVQTLYEQGEKNGVQGQRIIEKDEALRLEPNLSPEVVCALLEPMSGLTSPYELTCALADHAAVNGVAFLRETFVSAVEKKDGGFMLHTSRGDFAADILINCAGVNAAKLHNQLSPVSYEIIPRKGEYYLLDHEKTPRFSMTMFQTPTAMGKGVLVSPTVHGNLLLGPTADDIPDSTDVSTTAAGLKTVMDRARLTWPGLSLRTTVTTFAGVRAHEKGGDFIIGATEGAPGAYETIGIESPGLSASPAIAKMLTEQIVRENGLTEKETWLPAPKREKHFYDMTLEERIAAVKKDPANGVLVCRCEQVTEAEVRAAIRRPVGATTIDGVKRRTRAGMGRCQGGFCSPRVLEILAEELHIQPTEVTKCGGESKVLVGTIAQAMEKENAKDAE